MKKRNEIYYTYKITFDDGYYYYGKRRLPLEFTTIEEDYNYTGSPITNKEYWERKIPLSKTILASFNNEIKCGNHETKLLKDCWDSDELCLNASPGGGGNTGTNWYNNGEISIMCFPQNLPKGEIWLKGRISGTCEGKKYYNDGEISRMFFEGEEPVGWVRGNLSSQGERNGMFGKIGPLKDKNVYHNEEGKTIYLNKADNVPEGFIEGRTDNFKLKRSILTKGKNNPRYGERGRKFYNNGKKCKLFYPGEEPVGWVKGMK